MKVFPLIIMSFYTQSSLASINGLGLKNLIDCFAFYLPEASLRPDNSNTKDCEYSQILYCKTDSGNNDHFCKFDGTNHLKDDLEANPSCYFNCQMETCNAWDIPHDEHQIECVNSLTKKNLKFNFRNF